MTAPGRLALAASVVCALGLAPSPAGAQLSQPAWTPDERARILLHGPWPPPQRRDPSNPLSGDAFAIEFGRRLFHDPSLSANGYVACVGCHQTDRAFADGIARARGLAPLPRNTIALANLQQQRWFGWGGGADSLWMASLRPMLDAREMDVLPSRAVARFALSADLSCRYRVLFGRAPAHANDELLVNLAKAIAAYLETFITGRSAFDTFRDALARGDRVAMSAYPAAAQRGLRLFIGSGACSHCHSGPNFSDGAFHEDGVPLQSAAGKLDAGRDADLRALRASRFNRHGPFSNSRPIADMQVRQPAAAGQTLQRAWRTPSLRNVTASAPYMHDGSLDTLDAVISRHAMLPTGMARMDGERLLRPPALDAGERADVVAFLTSLNAPVITAPADATDCIARSVAASQR
jgi:cytochrome c peroxidase